jgi:hypothetical protein
LPRSLHLIADLGVADALDETPRSAADLAAETGAHPQALARTLRLLSAYGVFATRAGMVSHTASSRLLRSDHPQSMRPFARMLGLPINLEAYRLFGDTLRTGRPAISLLAASGFQMKRVIDTPTGISIVEAVVQ